MSTVTTTPVILNAGSQLIQNLGPDDLYVGQTADGVATVTTANGIRLSVGESISYNNQNTKPSVVSSGTSEVRTMHSVTGVYLASAPAV
ncbi:hypothetical protein SEA_JAYLOCIRAPTOR_3 [Streptomyces phage Jaylociraptor]|uniref:Uncharacterized protein n=12 Tax=Rimavirus rima TaxID=2560784 RepID=A0A515MIS1_9CAUD|nr:hypothetical protein FDH06_gp03 [Streptomyces phage Rima]AOZ64953.1 hypothetical protein SEA_OLYMPICHELADO_3 [Streptomyces phage OlympicHelado]ASU03999.1 hypothetical protein SEA_SPECTROPATRONM_3 [Streptomyces phage Spectropatronm]QAY16215.1 hypothetical protein SEA_ICEWARRIOR_3 [Streptomyces phage IceWarrior]QAY16301.1 hypothetical protein SEA_NAMO_3 [Streptomyces phage Namo]QAY17121.1 hypothetical protein SEA_MADAMATO_3 [Streptomyces phage Madamato]QDM56504.1 hypothetical protein SEA_ESK